MSSSGPVFRSQVCQDNWFKKKKRNSKTFLSSEEQIQLINDKEEKLMKCQFCEKKFKHTSILKRHELTHTKETPHACELCGAKFAQVSNRNAHMKNVCQNIKVPCPICGINITGASNLKHHLDWTHKMKPRLNCEICGTSVRCNMSRHVKTKSHIDAVSKLEKKAEEELEQKIQAQRINALFEVVEDETFTSEQDNEVIETPELVANVEVENQSNEDGLGFLLEALAGSY